MIHIKIGDYVTRKKYNNDIVFKIVDIKDNICYLCGVELRLYADSNIDDLVLTSISKKKLINNCIRKINTNSYFYIPGVILHLDTDIDYLKQCEEYYKSQKIKYYGILLNIKEYCNKVEKLINKYKPNIIVITGHDAYYKKTNTYKNSKYYIDTVKRIREFDKEIIIISGACQSDYINLIKNGSTFASSPAHININALDPAIIASYIALTDKNDVIDLEDILSKTKYGSNGIGGIRTKGCMISVYPRKELN